MERELFQRIRRLFLDAVQLSGKEREAFLREAVRRDAEAGAIVAALLEEHDALGQSERDRPG